MECRADEVATCVPKTVSPESLATEALRMMNERKISALFAVDAEDVVCGILHIHDCLRAGVV